MGVILWSTFVNTTYTWKLWPKLAYTVAEGFCSFAETAIMCVLSRTHSEDPQCTNTEMGRPVTFGVRLCVRSACGISLGTTAGSA